jgi:D-3-phosphoglycerate dehydrogenase
VSRPDTVVLVTPRSFDRDDAELRGRLEQAVGRVEWRLGTHAEAELQRLVRHADGWIAGTERIGRSVLEHADRLRVIARYGVGVDNVDLEFAGDRGIQVTNTPGANSGAVAELVIGLMLALARRIPAADRAVRAGAWSMPGGIALEGKTVGLLGFGQIGQAVARKVSGFGTRVLAYDPLPARDSARALGVELVDRQAVIAQSDFLSLHLPVRPETRNLVDADFLGAMKPGAFLINAARGELVDEAALVAALRDGRLAGAGLDGLAHEPPPAGFALGQLDNVILTPHVGAQSDLARRRMGQGAVENCLAVLRGDTPPNPVATPRSAAA